MLSVVLVGCIAAAPSHLRKGDAYQREMQWDKAIEEYTLAIKFDEFTAKRSIRL
jgi:hypothetical protein